MYQQCERCLSKRDTATTLSRLVVAMCVHVM